MKAGWSASELDPHEILLLSYRLMAAASADSGPSMTAATLMTAERARTGPPRPGTDGTGGAPSALLLCP
ncbi:hypothetical protein [Streptomyces sp. NPDC056660]|uniref:hypothetical protein n=1 Tax=Streptomyces sp. NPDC056660 TaxID=3345897 RepID=UPI0036CE08BE